MSKDVNIKNSKCITSQLSVIAVALPSIDSYLKKDILSLLGKMTNVAPVKFSAENRVAFSHGYSLSSNDFTSIDRLSGSW